MAAVAANNRVKGRFPIRHRFGGAGDDCDAEPRLSLKGADGDIVSAGWGKAVDVTGLRECQKIEMWGFYRHLDHHFISSDVCRRPCEVRSARRLRFAVIIAHEHVQVRVALHRFQVDH